MTEELMSRNEMIREMSALEKHSSRGGITYHSTDIALLETLSAALQKYLNLQIPAIKGAVGPSYLEVNVLQVADLAIAGIDTQLARRDSDFIPSRLRLDTEDTEGQNTAIVTPIRQDIRPAVAPQSIREDILQRRIKKHAPGDVINAMSVICEEYGINQVELGKIIEVLRTDKPQQKER